MFENAQQEPSPGTGKVIGGVVVAALVIMAAVYFMFLRGQPGATPQTGAPAAATGGGAPAKDADFKRDLTIQRPNLGRDQTQTQALWDFQIVNRSRTIAYRNLKYITTYYDNGGNMIQQGSGTIPGEVEPGDQRTVSSLNDGLYPLSTARYTIEISGADGYMP